MLSNTSQMTIFLSGRQRTGVLCMQHSPTAAVLSTNTAFKWKIWFSCFPVLPSSAEAQVIWGGMLKHLLTFWLPTLSVTFLPKNINLFMCVKVIASNRWDVFFETKCIYSYTHTRLSRTPSHTHTHTHTHELNGHLLGKPRLTAVADWMSTTLLHMVSP